MQEHKSTSPREGASATGSGSLSQSAKSKAQDIKVDVQNKAQNVRRTAEDAAESQKHGLSGRGEAVAGAISRLAEELDSQEEAWLGNIARSMANRVERVSSHVQERSAQELMEEVRGLSRHPVAFLGGAFTVGLIAGRFMKSSDSNGRQADFSDSLDASLDRSDQLGAPIEPSPVITPPRPREEQW